MRLAKKNCPFPPLDTSPLGSSTVHSQFLTVGPRDSLTGLPDRPMLLDVLAWPQIRSSQRLGRRTSILLLDMSRFRGINDAFGHETGDLLLITLARRVESQLPSDAILARLGGACFGVLMHDIADPDKVHRVANRIHRELASPFHLEGHEIFVNAHMGLAFNHGLEDRPESLLRDAETALYYAKEVGSHFEIFKPSLRFEAVARFQLENELRQALDRQEFCLTFQPMISLPERKLVGFETLIRWRHPRRGILCPKDFLPIAIKMGLVSHIDQWVLGEACRQLASWRTMGLGAADISVSVNLTAPEILDTTLPNRLEKLLSRNNLQSKDLKLELTEWARLEPSKQVKNAISRLRDRGIGLFVDDFGTGYSGLSYLHYISGEALKIDRSFIAGLGTSKVQTRVVESIIRLAKELDMIAVAEGVESDEQLEHLEELGCDRAQGFLLGIPMASETIPDFLRELEKETPSATMFPRPSFDEDLGQPVKDS